MENSTEQIAHKYILENFLDSYLVQRNAEKTFSLVTEDIYSLGTGKQEVAHNKEEFKQLIIDELKQLPMPIIYKLDTYQEKNITDQIFTCVCDVTTHIQIDERSDIRYTTRLTAGFKKVKDAYLAYHLHMSEASSTQQECEFFPVHYGKKVSQKIDADKQMELIELMKKIIPGGAMGGYVEPGFPLYFINEELLNWLGYTYDEFIDENGQRMSNTMHPDDVAMVETVINEAFKTGNEYSVEYRMRKKDNSYIWVRDIGRKMITNDGRVAMISIIVDVSNEKLRQQSFERTIDSMKKERRRIDRMTNLLNREPAEVLIEQYLVRERQGALFIMDIDNFKLVNDTKGHPVGDRVLYTFANQLKAVFPENAVIARLGGDEFVVFMPVFHDTEQLRSYAEEVVIRAERLINDVLLANKLGVSIGIAIAPEDGMKMKEIYSNADKALYCAKQNGKNRYRFYKQSSVMPNMDENRPNIDTLQRMVLGGLIEKGAFKVEYEAFSKIFQFILRNANRLKQVSQVVLFSIDNDMDADDMADTKKLLEYAIQSGLRIGDVMMDFSINQIAALLVNCKEEDAVNVAERIIGAYKELDDCSKVKVRYENGSINNYILK